MENEIFYKAEQKMKQLYGQKIPVEICNRFETEHQMLNGEEMLRWIDFIGELQEQISAKEEFMINLDSHMCASFIAWLLGGNNVNPLPAHYYCPKCKKVEFIPNVRCGYDAPDKICSCGHAYEKDGFDIAPIHMKPTVGGCEICISPEVKEVVKDRFYGYFGKYGAVRQLKFADDEEKENCHKEYYAFMPGDMADDYPEEVLTISRQEYCSEFLRLQSLTVEKDTDHLSIHKAKMTNYSLEDIRGYAKYAVDSGFFKDEEANVDLSEAIRSLSNPSFSDLIAAYGIMRSAGTWKGNGEISYADGIGLTELISNRDDVYLYLYDKIQESEQAYKIEERLRKGLYAIKGMPDEVEDFLKESGVADWYVESMKKTHFLPAKARLITSLKMDIAKYLMSLNDWTDR